MAVVTDATVTPAAAVEAAFAAIARVQRVMSAHDPTSDLRRLAAAPLGEPIDCDPWTVRLLRLADRLRLDSAGLFDIALGSAGGAAGYRIVGPARLVLTVAGARFDTGGIAKGFAVDAAVATLRAHGVRDGWIEAGGDLRVFGAFEHEIMLRELTPGGPLLRPIGLLARGAVATSQYLESGFSAGKGDALHRPAGNSDFLRGPVTVIAPRCALADALTKPLALLGPAAADLLARHGSTGCLVTPADPIVFIPPLDA